MECKCTRAIESVTRSKYKNSTKVECKLGEWHFYQTDESIRIVPKWNVNLHISSYSLIGVLIRIVPKWNVNVAFFSLLEAVYHKNSTKVECKYWNCCNSNYSPN